MSLFNTWIYDKPLMFASKFYLAVISNNHHLEMWWKGSNSKEQEESKTALSYLYTCTPLYICRSRHLFWISIFTIFYMVTSREACICQIFGLSSFSKKTTRMESSQKLLDKININLLKGKRLFYTLQIKEYIRLFIIQDKCWMVFHMFHICCLIFDWRFCNNQKQYLDRNSTKHSS